MQGKLLLSWIGKHRSLGSQICTFETPSLMGSEPWAFAVQI